MTDVFKRLPPFEWRGYKYAVTSREVSFAHEGVQQRLQYRDNSFIEQLGAHSLTFRYTIAAREDIYHRKYEKAFTEGYLVLFESCRDRDRGVLYDPFLGPRICVCVSFSDQTDPSRRDGTDVTVEFVESPDPNDEELADPPLLTIDSLSSAADAMDEELADVDWEQQPSPEPTMDPLNAVSGYGAQIDAQAGRATAALEDFAFRCEKVEQQIDSLENGAAVWPLKQALRRNRANAISASRRAKDPLRTIVTITRGQRQLLSTLAAEFGMSLQELIQLNPEMARKPYVPAGQAVRVTKKNDGNR